MRKININDVRELENTLISCSLTFKCGIEPLDYIQYILDFNTAKRLSIRLCHEIQRPYSHLKYEYIEFELNFKNKKECFKYLLNEFNVMMNDWEKLREHGRIVRREPGRYNKFKSKQSYFNELLKET